jgi:hypothetical protein
MDIGDSTPGVNLQGLSANHSPPFSGKVLETLELYLHSPVRQFGTALK